MRAPPPTHLILPSRSTPISQELLEPEPGAAELPSARLVLDFCTQHLLPRLPKQVQRVLSATVTSIEPARDGQEGGATCGAACGELCGADGGSGCRRAEPAAAGQKR